uniref:Uncharacterized protein n=1 Tax=Opuntia streptacantha TaxID=393608 RepID=A0A7C9DN04_OPUST
MMVDLPTPGGPITPTTVNSVLSVKKGRKRSKWKSQESERRLREPTGGRRDRIEAAEESSSPAPRMNFPVEELPATRPGLARSIFGAGDDEPWPAVPLFAILLGSFFFPFFWGGSGILRF